MYSNIQRVICAFALLLSFSLQAIEIPQEERDRITQEVITELGRYDAAEIEMRARLWLVEQPLPGSSGELVGEGDCTGNCQASAKRGANLPEPRNVKFKGKKRQGKYAQHIQVKWKRPVRLDKDSPYRLSHYLVHMVLKGQTYKDYRVDAQFKDNGRPVNKQKIVFQNLPDGDYTVDVLAVYENTATRRGGSTTTTLANQTLTRGGSGSVKGSTKTVANLNGPATNLYNCLINAPNNYPTGEELADIQTANCSNKGLTNSDIDNGTADLTDMVGLTYLDLSNNPALTDLYDLYQLPNLSWLDISYNTSLTFIWDLAAMDTFIATHMGFNIVPPDVVLPSDITYLDLSNNPITGNLNQLTNSLITTLKINDNTGSPNFSQLSGKNIETLELKNSSLSDISDLSGINGLKFLTLDGSNLSGIQSLQDFTGFCGLSINDTQITNLNKNRPVKFLILKNNPLLKRTKLYEQHNDPSGNSRIFIPKFLDYTGSNGLTCPKYYEFVDARNSNPIVNMEVSHPIDLGGGNIQQSPTCPVLLTEPSGFIEPDYCKAPEPTSLHVYEDQFPSRRFFTWTRNQNHDYSRWQISNFLITGRDTDGNIVSSDTFSPTESVGSTPNLAAVDYEISACSKEGCGYPRAMDSLGGGITIVDQENVEMIGTDEFKLLFRYPQSAFDGGPYTKPDYFRVTALYTQSSGTAQFFDIPVNGNTNYNHMNTDGNWWASENITINQYFGNAFSIKACNNTLGCGEQVSLTVQTEEVDNSLSAPVWITVERENVNDEKRIKLQWSVDLNDDFDYIKIRETQPLIYSDYTVGAPTKIETELEYFTDEISEPLVLHRSVKGEYDFELFACKRNRVNGDICSASSGEFSSLADYAIGRDEIKLENDSFPPLQQPHPVLRKPQEFKLQSTSKFSWRYRYLADPNTIKPDYFHIKNVLGNACVLADGTLAKEITIEAIKLGDTNTSRDRCSSINGAAGWQIRSCIYGAGCSSAADLDPTLALRLDELPEEPKKPSNKVPGVDTESALFNPGIWVHPDSPSSGWYFFWANHQATAEVGEYPLHGSSYDLIGYWFTYKQDETTGYWTPIWYWTKMIKESPENNVYGNIYKGAIIKRTYNGIDGAEDGEIVGHLVLNLDGDEPRPSVCTGINSGRCNVLEINADTGSLLTHLTSDDELGPYTMDLNAPNGHLKLIIEDFSIGIMDCQEDGSVGCGSRFGFGNDIDHYSGAWQAASPSGTTLNSKISMLTWIERGLEFTTIASFDDVGEPIWAVAQTCNASICQRSTGAPLPPGVSPGPFGGDAPYLDLHTQTPGFFHNLYWVTNAPAPFKGYPDGYTQYNQPVGVLARAYRDNLNDEDDDYNLAQADIVINVDWQYRVDNTLDGPTRSVNIDTGGAVDLIKQANFHGINFTVPSGNHGDNPATLAVEIDPNTCDPTKENGVGGCYIRFNWFTDATYSELEPYYFREEDQADGVTIWPTFFKVFKDEGSNDPESRLSCTREPIEVNVSGLICLITEPGTYEFRLMKPPYEDIGQDDITIAKSETLHVLPCNGSPNCDPNFNPDSIGEYTPSGEPAAPTDVAVDVHTITHVEGSGPLPGSGSVSGGSATYNIPMVTPPGRNGMAPELSVNYSSRGGNGVMGVGWSVSLGSIISRCPKTVAQDGTNETITIDNRDRLCLDGQRLILDNIVDNGSASDDDYWSSGNAEYRTEINSFARIKKVSGTTFTVETRSGLTLTYEQQGSDPLNWYLIDKRDTFGNYIEYTYQEHGTNEWLLDKVYYSGHNTTRGTRSIEFTYSARGIDYNKTYLWGHAFERSQKLDRITTKVGASIERAYEFGYDNSSVNEALLLETVTEKAYGSNGEVERVIAENSWSDDDWGGNQADYEYTDLSAGLLNDPVQTKILMREAQISSDFNGDGIKEYLIFPRRPGYQGIAKMIFLNSNGNIQKVLEFSESVSQFQNWVNVAQPGDVDADGYTDLVLSENNNLKVYSWKNGVSIDDANLGNSVSEFFNTHTTNVGYKWLDESEGRLLDRDVSKVYFMDFNNDGKQDILMEQQPFIPPGGGFDGPAELVWFKNTTIHTGSGSNISSNINFDAEEVLLETQPYGDLEPEDEVRFILWNKIVSIEDFNGDNIPDVYMRRVSAVSVNREEEIIPQVRAHFIAFMIPKGELSDTGVCLDDPPNNIVNEYCAVQKEVSSLGMDNIQCQHTATSTPFDCIETPQAGVTVANGRSVNPMDMISYKFHDVNGDGLKDLLYYNLAYATLVSTGPTSARYQKEDNNLLRFWKVRLNQGGEVNNLSGANYAIFENADIKSIPSNPANEAFIPQGTECENAFTGTGLTPDRMYEVRRLCHTVFRSAAEFNDINGDGIGELLFPGSDQSSLLFNHCDTMSAAPLQNNSTRSATNPGLAIIQEPDDFSLNEQVRRASETHLAAQLDMSLFIDTVNNGFEGVGEGFGDDTCYDSICLDEILNRSDTRGGGGQVGVGPEVVLNACSADHFDIINDSSQSQITYYDPFINPTNSNWDGTHHLLSTGSATQDNGLYRFKAIEFRLKSNGELGLELIENTGIYKTLQGSHMGDVTGDGLMDDFAGAGCTNNSNENSCQDSKLYDGMTSGYPDHAPADWNISEATLTAQDQGGIALLTKNISEMPNMLTSVTKPEVNQWVSWVYSPISGGSDIYQVEERDDPNKDGYLDSAGVSGEYFYFNSSMYVVAEMLQSNGLNITGGIHETERGDGYSTTSYEYEGAVYNNAGRGFQGFRKITVTNNPKPDDDTFATKSISTFHQVFPKAGKLERIETLKINEPGDFPVSVEMYNWDDVNHNDVTKGIYFIPPLNKTTQQFELGSSNMVSELVSTYDCDSGGVADYDNYGNNTCSETTRKSFDIDTLGGTGEVVTQTNKTISQYAAVDTTDWILNRLTLQSNSSTISYGSQHSSTAGFSTQGFVNIYSWETGKRQLNCQGTYSDSAISFFGQDGCDVPLDTISTQQSVSKFIYDTNYGNVIRTETRGVAHGIEETRKVETVYNDGYFPNTVNQFIDSSNFLQSTYNYDAGTGQLQSSTDPNGIISVNEYDAFGFLIGQEVGQSSGGSYSQISPAVSTVMFNCVDNPTACADASIVDTILTSVSGTYTSAFDTGFFTDTYLAKPVISYVSEQIQAGAPTVKTYYDSEGNAVLTYTKHSLDDHNYTLQLTNPLGAQEIASQPFALNPSDQIVVLENKNADGTDDADVIRSHPFVSLYKYDELGRVVKKQIEIGDLDTPDSPSSGNCVMDTAYIHEGFYTTITAGPAAQGTCTTGLEENNNVVDTLTMKRRYDASGRLLWTEDAKSYTASYWYDALGNVQIIQDDDGHQITALHDLLGRKYYVYDQNMGEKNFTYNGFGEIETERDATQELTGPSGLRNNYYYDGLGRLWRKETNVDSNQLGDTTSISYVDNYTYDNYPGIGCAFGRLCHSERLSNEVFNSIGLVSDRQSFSQAFGVASTTTLHYDSKARLTRRDMSYENVLGDEGNGSEDRRYSTYYHYDEGHNRLKQINYGSDFGVYISYTQKYGALEGHKEVLRNGNSNDLAPGYLLQNFDWNLQGQLAHSRMSTGIINDKSLYYPSTNQIARQWHTGITGSGIAEQRLTYKYDFWGNIIQRGKDELDNTGTAIPNFTVTEDLTYDSIHRLAEADRSNASQAETYLYSNLGNITLKSDFATAMAYGNNGGGPNAISNATLIGGSSMSYHYDVRGNRIRDDISGNPRANYRYDSANLLIRGDSTIRPQSSDAQTLYFRYGSDNQRYFKYDERADNNYGEITLYGGKDYEQVYNASNGVLKETKYYLTDYLTVTKEVDQSTGQYHYLQKDRLGSTTQVLDVDGIRIYGRSYDAFGKPRDANWNDIGGLFEADLDLSNEPNSSTAISKRGFTDHEHLDYLQLIHMNGRMFDFNNGRFLSVDPYIIGSNSQAINPYSYIYNNPLSGTDPSGYFGMPDDRQDMINALMKEGYSYTEAYNIVVDAEIEGLKNLVIYADQASDIANPAKGGIKQAVKEIGTLILSIGGKSGSKKAASNGVEKTGDKIEDVSNIKSQDKLEVDLEKRAKEVHGELDETAQRFRTTAATEAVDKDGNKVVIISSSEKRLTKKQRESLREGEIEGIDTVKKEHAEVTGINTAKEKGLTPTATAASRPICPTCQQTIKENNVVPKSPLKKPPKQKNPPKNKKVRPDEKKK